MGAREVERPYRPQATDKGERSTGYIAGSYFPSSVTHLALRVRTKLEPANT